MSVADDVATGQVYLVAGNLSSGATEGASLLLRSPAPPHGAVVALSASPAALLVVPPSVTLSSGSMVTTLAVTGGTVAMGFTKTGTLTASFGGRSTSSAVSVSGLTFVPSCLGCQ